MRNAARELGMLGRQQLPDGTHGKIRAGGPADGHSLPRSVRRSIMRDQVRALAGRYVHGSPAP